MRILALASVLMFAVGCEMDANIAREDAGCSTPIDCAAPPAGCAWEGGTCESCGTLVCEGIDAGCVPVECPAPPAGCDWVGGDLCTTCGSLRCMDAGFCETPVDCPAPPDGCHYEGGDFCTSCGTLVCDTEIDCSGTSVTSFPTFDRTCSADTDCAVVEHQISCCGTLAALGIRADQESAFDAAEATCRGMLAACGCAQGPTVADDGTDGSGAARVSCVEGQCTSTFGLAENEICTGGGVCGAGLSCCYPCGIPDCDFRCEPTCSPGDPGCVDGCFLRP